MGSICVGLKCLLLIGLSVEEHNELVRSVEPLRGSVGRMRIILANKRTSEVIQTSSASLVYKGDERSLVLTCGHNFGKKSTWRDD